MKQNNQKEDRRNFLKNIGFGLLGISVLSNFSFENFLGSKALAKELPDFKIEGKKDLIYHGEKPLTAETEIYALDSDFTKPENFFVRNNGLLPSLETIKERLHKGWTLEIDGESIINKKSYTIEDLKKKFKTYTYALTVECGGNGRSEVIPSTKGTQWGYGAVACGRWTGVRLKDILKDCGIKNDAVYIGYYGIDTKLNGEETSPISRGVPISKALQDETLIAWAGELEVSEVYISNDYGVTWTKAKVEKPLNRLAWQKWSAQISIPTKGYYEIWARAIDSQGNSQPMVLAQWNPGGYINNACHRVNVYGV
ncbi:molybdopterin-dependent oxidoreductase [Campylobacter jejuni]|nr:molybdopterin-dependent oxidoreductase [Campylobacter jejuni]EHX5467765.1 molybdopterin-dependent oxidoreductase [Campylobacter jejuni]EKI9289494.1 molybdopterin-dependent oxidoreductase [Campylobacter jejuni]ELC9000868.1 molybdopterin-dependent oxidoreductase [Campylobacter jejuni]ELH5067701.1 molybdopterin-dependent oxidoreductase [Campylobacter jejuni]